MALNVLQVTPFYPPDKAGIAVHVINLSNCIAKLGLRPTVIAPKRITTESSQDSDIKVEKINSIYLSGWPYPTLRSMSIPLDFGSKIRSIIRKKEFHIVHVHGHHYPISWLAIKEAHKNGIPAVLTLHGMFALNPFVSGGETRLERILNKYFFPKILEKTSAIVGLTQSITNYAKSIGGNSTRYYTIPNGINTEDYQRSLSDKSKFRIKYGIKHDSIVILFRGRFEHVKGILEFIGAIISILSESNLRVEILIVGGGTLEKRIREKVDSIDGIHVIGWQKEDEIHELYIASDIFVLPSRFEALPITIIEAMNANLHIIYTDVGGVSDILTGYDKKTLLPEVSQHEIKNAISYVVNNYSSDRTENSKSLSYARSLDWRHIANQINDLYESILQERGSIVKRVR